MAPLRTGDGFANVVVTAVASTTSVAPDAENTWQLLLEGRSGIRELDRPFVSEFKSPVRIGGPLGIARLPEEAKGPAFAVATGLLVYPQAVHLEHFEPRRTRHVATGTGGYLTRVGRWLRESF